MTENEINSLIEKTLSEFDESQKIIEKLQYVMDFGEVTIQYDFCLN
jgi:hypothetical protein